MTGLLPALRRGVVAALVALLAVGCGGSAVPDDSVTAMYEALGGEQWCGTELRITFQDAIGSCGPEDARVLLSTDYADLDTLRDGVEQALGEELLLLLPDDPAGGRPWFDVRSRDREVLQEAQKFLGGSIHEGDAAIQSWLDTLPAADGA